MNRISSLKQRTAANKHRDNSSPSKSQRSSELIQSSLDWLEHGRCNDASIAAESRGSSDKTPTRSRSSSSIPNNHSYCASTVDSTGSTNHSSIFSKSDDSTHDHRDDGDQRDVTVKGGYIPDKVTLGLELVASPSLLRQVLIPPSESTTDFPSGSSLGGNTIRSKISFWENHVKAGSDSVDYTAEDDREEGDDAEHECDITDDIFDDDDSDYTAMQTVAETVVTTNMKQGVVASESLQPQDDDADGKEIGEIPFLKQSLSMRSAKSSEGMEVNDFFNTVWDNDDHDDNDDREDNSSIGQPFDEGSAMIIASSKAEALMAAHSNPPPSCLKPSSFNGQRTNLPSPAIVQDRRVGRAGRLAKLRKTFDKLHVDVTFSNAVSEKKDFANTNVKQKTGLAGETPPCFSAPVVSFAEYLEETHPMDEIKNDLSKDSAPTYESPGIHSPTGVQEIFPLDDYDKDSDKGQELNSVDSGNSGPDTSLVKRLNRNREALKSIALARGRANDGESKKNLDDDVIDCDDELMKDADATPPEEVTAPLIVQSVSELDIPQFCPSMDLNASKEENVNDSFQSVDGHDERERNQDTSQKIDDAVQSPSMELDASALLEVNTSLDSTSSKIKRFLPRLRLKSKGNSTTAVVKQTPSVGSNNSGNKMSIRSKFFKSKSSSKKSEESRKKDESSNKVQALEIENVKDVDKSAASLSFSEQSTFTLKDSQKDSDQMSIPGNNEPVQTRNEPQLPNEIIDNQNKKNEVPTPSILIKRTQSESSGKAAVIGDIQASALSTRGRSTSSEVIETSFITADKEIDTTATADDAHPLSFDNIKPAPILGARSSSTPLSSSKTLKAPLHSTSSLQSSSPMRASLEPMPIESKSRSTPSRARSTGTRDGASLLNNSNITSSPGLKSESSFAGIAGFGSSSFEREANQSLETSVDNHLATSNFGDELAYEQIQIMFPEFCNPRFVEAEPSGGCESGVEVEWSKSEETRNEFLDEPVVLDTTGISIELEQPESKWESGTKGDDISWPSDVDCCNQKDLVRNKRPDEDVLLKVVDEYQGSDTDNVYNVIEEASTKTGGTKSSSLHPRILFRDRSKNHDDRTKLEDDDETLSDHKRVVSSEKKRSSHSSKKGRRDRTYRSSRVIGRTSDEDDCRSIDEESEDDSSEDYSSDDQENVVATIATSIQKGFTGIVDMMETAFAFGHAEETGDYESESSESEEDDDDSYIQRKMAKRMYKQRKLLQDARRHSQAHRNRNRWDKSKERSGERKRVSKSSKYSNNADASIVSEEDESHRGQRYKSSRRHRSSSGRGGSRRRVESRHRGSRR